MDKQGQLHLVNHLGIEGLGETPEEILTNLQEGNFDPAKIIHDERMASDKEYDERVRDVTSDIPSRFNADERRLFEASGCAGKLGVLPFGLTATQYPKKSRFFTLAPMTLRN
ncbi:D-lactate dehydrogenase [Vibrio alginolyticus 40B]|nr:D-lactate dehydrogenase [Vibrio alginolyticus 40B]